MNRNDLVVHYMVVRRDGNVVSFNPVKIRVAIANAFLKNADGAPYHAGHTELSQAEREQVNAVSDHVVETLFRRKPEGGAIHIEDIQDQVELYLMRSGQHEIARNYVLYRHARHKERAARQNTNPTHTTLTVLVDGKPVELESFNLRRQLHAMREGLRGIEPDAVYDAAVRDMFQGARYADFQRALIYAARARIETEPDYNYFAAQLLLASLRQEVLYQPAGQLNVPADYETAFPGLLHVGIQSELLDPRLAEFDLDRLAQALHPERDFLFGYLGLQTLYDRYFLHVDGWHFELPQTFFMRVAMGLALNEQDRNARAIEFYDVLSQFDYMASTPTLFNSGTRHAQLSSCYLTTVPDDLDGIFGSIKDNAMLQKYAGGLGNDWTRVRALGAPIKGTNGKSQGTVPFLKVANDTAVAVNQGGKRKGAVCAYLETWHLDIEEFLELRKNSGDDRRRTHDMNTAHWIPDLFMERVEEGGNWTLFSPSDVPDLHDLFGPKFAAAYVNYETQASNGIIKQFKTVPAQQLWRKMISMLFETGHPWICFKDACNIRSPQQHVGVIHSSNLCTEITLNTSDDEIAVCNLGSVNLVNHLVRQPAGHCSIDAGKLEHTVAVAMRMLDNVIALNYYAVEKAKASNQRHRPVGLGIMGFQDCLHQMGVAYDSVDAARFADTSMQLVCFYAYAASAALAEERGAYPTFVGSLWDQGILPQDTVKMLAESRQSSIAEPNVSDELPDWKDLRRRIRTHGIRNSNCVAIAPTATIANIVGVSASIEPVYQNLYVKSNLSGEFTIVNAYLVDELKALGLWDAVMVADLKHYDGSVAKIDRIPAHIRQRFATAFEIDPRCLVECAARRGRWIDQSQSLNLYVAGASGKQLDELYRLAWKRGLKTTYYLRTLAASSAEKSTGRGGELTAVTAVPACRIDDPSCESCQ